MSPVRDRMRVSNLLYDGEGDKGQVFILLRKFECSLNDWQNIQIDLWRNEVGPPPPVGVVARPDSAGRLGFLDKNDKCYLSNKKIFIISSNFISLLKVPLV